MRELRQNTATRVTVGPFLDKTDGITPEVALTVTSEKLTLMVDDAGVPTLVLDAAPTASGGANDMVHVTNDDAGFYDLELAAANVNYLGRAMLGLNDVATHLPVFHEFMIISAEEWDRKYDTVGAIPTLGIIDRGPLQSLPSTTTSTIRAAAAFGDNTLIGCVLSVLGGTLAPYWQSVIITSNVGATDVLTHPAFAVTPTGTCLYTITGTPQSNPALTVAATIASGGITTASFAAGAIDAAAIAANAIGASELATDAVTEIANAVVEAEITALKTYDRSANTTAAITGPTTGVNALTVATDAAYEPIKTL